MLKRNLSLLLLATTLLVLPACDSTPEEKGELVVTDLVEGTGTEVRAGHTLLTSYVGGTG